MRYQPDSGYELNLSEGALRIEQDEAERKQWAETMDVGFWEGTGAMFRLENTFYNFVETLDDLQKAPSEQERVGAYLSGFNPGQQVSDLVKENPQWGFDGELRNYLIESGTQEEFDRRIVRVNQIAADREILANQGMTASLIQALGVGITDPVSIGVAVGTAGIAVIPTAMKFAGAVHTAQALGKLHRVRNAALASGDTVRAAQLQSRVARLTASSAPARASSGAISAAAGGLTDAAVTEFALQMTQPGRTMEETLYNVVGSMALSGVIGGAVGAARSLAPVGLAQADEIHVRSGARLVAEGENEIGVPGRDMELRETGDSPRPAYDDGTGNLYNPEVMRELAERHGEHTPEFEYAFTKHQEEYTGAKLQGIMKFTQMLYPGQRLAVSPLITTRNIQQNLLETEYMYNHLYADGARPISVETNIRGDNRKFTMERINILNETQAELAPLIPGLHRSELNAEIWKYITDDQYFPAGKFEPHAAVIERTVAKMKARIFDPIEKKLKAMDLIGGEIPAGHRLYLHRMWDLDAVNARRAELRSRLELWRFDSEIEAMGPERAEAVDYDQLRQRISRDVTDMMEALSNSRMSVLESELITKAKSLKARSAIPTRLVEDFMVKDIERITDVWLRDVIPEMRLVEKFGPDPEMNLLRNINEEQEARVKVLDEMISNSTNRGQTKRLEKEKAKINKRAQKDANTIKDVIAVMKGQYGHPKDPDSFWTNAGKIARSLNFVTKLGGMTVSSLTDIGNVVMKAGFRPVAGAMIESFQNIIGIKNSNTVSKQDMRDLGIVTELTLHDRMNAQFLMDDIPGAPSRVDQVTGLVSSKFAKLALMTHWNENMKLLTGRAYMIKIRRMLGKEGANINAKNLRTLADFGIDEQMAYDMRKYWDKHGSQEAGVPAPNMKQWHKADNGRDMDRRGAQAQDVLRRAITRLSDSAIVTPGAADIPLYMRTPMGRILGQFQTFPIAVINRVILPTMQRIGTHQGGAMNAFTGATTAISMGALVYVLKELAAGREPNLEYDNLMIEAVDRSGMLGIYFTGLMHVDNMLNDQLSKALFGEDFEAPHRMYDPVKSMMGPSVGLLGDTIKVAQGASSLATTGEASWSAGTALWRNIPGMNLFYLRMLTERTGLKNAALESLTGQEAPN